MATDDPFRERAAGPARVRDPTRVEAGRDEVSPQAGGLAEDEASIGSEALGAIEQELDLRLVQGRDTLDTVLHEDAELVPVLLERAEREVVRNARVPRLGDGLEASDEKAADLFADVDVTVVIAEHGQVRADARDGPCHCVEVLHGEDGHGDAVQRAQFARPHARTVHDDVAGDLAVARADAGDGAVTREDLSHRGLLHDARSARTGAGGERLRRVGRDHAAVVRNPDAAFEIVDAAEGPAATDLVAIHDVRLDPRVAAERDGPAELRHARRAPGDAEAAHLLPVRAHAGLGLEPRVQVGAVADEPRHRARAAQTADEPGGVPGRAARELLALEQDDVAPAELDEVIGDAAAGDAATDDDDAGLGHGRAPV